MKRHYVYFSEDRCKSCGLCVSACPKHLIEIDRGHMNAKGNEPAKITDESSCVGCGSCAIICPDGVITIIRETEGER